MCQVMTQYKDIKYSFPWNEEGKGKESTGGIYDSGVGKELANVRPSRDGLIGVLWACVVHHHQIYERICQSWYHYLCELVTNEGRVH